MNFNKYDYIIPIGSNCRIGEALNTLNYRKVSLPIDWTLTTTKSVYDGFKDEFKDYFNNLYCVIDVYNLPKSQFKCLFNKKYRINITHENEVNESEINKYNRRIKRLLEILNSDKKVLFIRNLLDCNVIDGVHKVYLNNELKINPKCNDLFWLYKLKDLLKEKYSKLEHDLLIIHYNTIDEKIKRGDVFYKKMSEKNHPVNWDYSACMKAINELNKNECKN
jgi:hypothetical protein